MLYKSNAVPASAKADVQKAGGTFVYGYDATGVAIARSDSPRPIPTPSPRFRP